jgi:hypothetical protein
MKPHPSPVPQRVPARSCIFAVSSKLFCTVSTTPSGFRRRRLAVFLAGAFRALDFRAVFFALALRASGFRLDVVFAFFRLFARVLRAFAIVVPPPLLRSEITASRREFNQPGRG